MTAVLQSQCGDKCDHVHNYLHHTYFGALSRYACMNSWEEDWDVVIETCKKKKKNSRN